MWRDWVVEETGVVHETIQNLKSWLQLRSEALTILSPHHQNEAQAQPSRITQSWLTLPTLESQLSFGLCQRRLKTANYPDETFALQSPYPQQPLTSACIRAVASSTGSSCTCCHQ